MFQYNHFLYVVFIFKQDGDEPYHYKTQAELVTVPDPEIGLVGKKHVHIIYAYITPIHVLIKCLPWKRLWCSP